MRRALAFIAWPFRLVWGLSKGLFLALAIASLALNVATVTVSGVFAAVSGTVAAVTGLSTVKARTEARTARLARQAQASRVTYRGARRTAREAVTDTSRRVSRRVAFASARNVGSMAGEALPFIGVAVIVGATAWELADACEMMKDMRELDAAFNPDTPVTDDEVCGLEVPTAAETWKLIAASPGAVWEGAQGLYDGLPKMSETYSQVLEWGTGFLDPVLDKEEQ